jgi:ABC-type dipeptide/oligopeptide/nickel transport system permease component
LLGIPVFWLALSVLRDGINTLELLLHISRLANQHTQATVLVGVLTFLGLPAGALMHPIAGAFSCHFRAGIQESIREHFLRGIPTEVVGFTPMLSG